MELGSISCQAESANLLGECMERCTMPSCMGMFMTPAHGPDDRAIVPGDSVCYGCVAQASLWTFESPPAAVCCWLSEGNLMT
jgi:hypothetical protein